MAADFMVVLTLANTVLGLFGLGLACVSLWYRREPPELATTLSTVRALDSDLSELSDKVNHWMRRDAVRRARAGREDGEAASLPAPIDKKAALRAKVAHLRSHQQ